MKDHVVLYNSIPAKDYNSIPAETFLQFPICTHSDP